MWMDGAFVFIGIVMLKNGRTLLALYWSGHDIVNVEMPRHQILTGVPVCQARRGLITTFTHTHVWHPVGTRGFSNEARTVRAGVMLSCGQEGALETFLVQGPGKFS